MFAAVISRWAARIDGMLRERLYLRYPAVLDVIDEIDRTGILPPLGEGAFNGFVSGRISSPPGSARKPAL